MKTRAAIVRGPGQGWEVTELELDEPKEHEVLVRVMACGLCHSDEHVREGGPYRYPMVGGHEGAGVVEKVGPSVTRVREGITSAPRGFRCAVTAVTARPVTRTCATTG